METHWNPAEKHPHVRHFQLHHVSKCFEMLKRSLPLQWCSQQAGQHLSHVRASSPRPPIHNQMDLHTSVMAPRRKKKTKKNTFTGSKLCYLKWIKWVCACMHVWETKVCFCMLQTAFMKPLFIFVNSSVVLVLKHI